MDSARWEHIQNLFHEAAGKPQSERLSFLETACEGDRQLIADVLSMLDEDSGGSSILDNNVAEVAARIIGKPGPSALPFDRFGPYRLLRVLGEGGMGVVYLAERDDLGSLVAIKLLRDAWMSPARRERFAVEQRTLAQLTHPAIARLYDADTLPDGTPGFVMEYVDGVPLTDYCAAQKLSLADRLQLFRQVCEAVQYAHSRAVIHRDLKPSNILVESGGAVKLLDFGIAKQLDHNDAPVDQTRTGLRLLTPAYAAPEQVRGEQVGIYTDVYSLGVILYELLAGKLPFDFASRTSGEVEAMIVNLEPEKPSLLAKRHGGAPGEPRRSPKASWSDLDVLCLNAMHKDPDRRYRSVDALIRDIDHYLAGEPLEARPDSAAYRLGKFVQRNRRRVAAAAAVLAIIIGLVVFYTVRLSRARSAALAEVARTERILRFTLNLFDGGDKAAGPASDLRVTTLIDRGIAEAATLDRDPAVQAELYDTLGEVYQKLGNLDRAGALLESALARRKSVFGPDDPRVAETLVKIGLLRDQQANFPEAERLVRQSLEIGKRNLPASAPLLVAATHALGKVLEDRGSYPQAIQLLQEAVRLRSTPGASQTDLADSLLELANAQFYAGHYAETESLNRRLLVMHRQLYGERHPLVAEDLINLGAVQQELGHYPDAEKFHRQALEITRAFYGENHYKTAENLTLVARAIIFEKRYDEAVALLERSLAIQEKVFGKVHPLVASELNELGSVALRRERYDEAEAYFLRVVDIYRTVHRGKHYLVGVGSSNLASVYLAKKEFTRAEPLFRQALAIFAQTLPSDHMNVGIARIKLGRTLRFENRFREAEAESLAGYRILSRQASPSVSWLQSARQDLTAIYAALQEPDKAKPFLQEQVALSGLTSKK